MKKVVIILFITNLFLSIFLISSIIDYSNKRNSLSEDDKQYIKNIDELKNNQEKLEQTIISKNGEISKLDKKIKEKQLESSGTAKYIMKINISQSHFTLDISEHLKDAMNDIDIYIEVSKEFYNKYKVGDKIADDFRVGSAVFKGSYGSWVVKVTEKKIV